MNKEQKAVVLDAAQEMQVNDEWWREFERLRNNNGWQQCSETFNPLCLREQATFRRKTKTITVTMPVPYKAKPYVHSATGLLLWFDNHVNRDQALAAIKEAME